MATSTELRRLVDERVRAVNEFRAAPDEEPRRKAWDAVEDLRTDIDKGSVELAERVEAMEAREAERIEEARTAAAAVTASVKPLDVGLPVDEIRAVVRGERPQFQFAMPIESRTDFTTTDTTTYASYTVPQSWAGDVINFQIASSGLLQAGPTVITTQGGNQINMAALTTDATSTATNEGDAATVSNVVFGTRALNAYRFDGFFSVANELLDDTGVNLVPLLRDYAGRSISALVNPYFTDPDTGTGSDTIQAVQLGCTSGLTAAAYTGVTLDELKELYYSVLPVYRARGKFVANSAVTLATARSKDGNGNYLWTPALAAGEADTFMGKPWYEDAYMDSLATGNEPVIFGDIAAGYTIRYAHGGMQFVVSKEFAVTSFETTFVWGMWVDGVVTDAIAIKSITLP